MTSSLIAVSPSLSFSLSLSKNKRRERINPVPGGKPSPSWHCWPGHSGIQFSDLWDGTTGAPRLLSVLRMKRVVGTCKTFKSSLCVSRTRQTRPPAALVTMAPSTTLPSARRLSPCSAKPAQSTLPPMPFCRGTGAAVNATVTPRRPSPTQQRLVTALGVPDEATDERTQPSPPPGDAPTQPEPGDPARIPHPVPTPVCPCLPRQHTAALRED